MQISYLFFLIIPHFACLFQKIIVILHPKFVYHMQNFILIAEAGDFIGEQKLIAQHLSGEWVGQQWQMADGSLWDIVVMGVGAINVMHALSSIPRDAHLLNIGYAGSANYEIGSAVCVTEARLNHPNVRYPEPELHLAPCPAAYLREAENCIHSVCYSNTDFVLQSDYTDCVFDMELAYIAAMGFTHLHALKIVSDNLSLHTYREVAAAVE
jgi:hypothetical protein